MIGNQQNWAGIAFISPESVSPLILPQNCLRLTDWEQYSALRQVHSHYSACSPQLRQAESYPCWIIPLRSEREPLQSIRGFASIHTAGCEPSPWREGTAAERGAATATLVCSDLPCGLGKLAPVSVLLFLLAMLCLHLATDGTQNDGAPGTDGCCWGSSVTKTTTAFNHSSDTLDCSFCFLAFSQFSQGFLHTKKVIS